VACRHLSSVEDVLLTLERCLKAAPPRPRRATRWHVIQEALIVVTLGQRDAIAGERNLVFWSLDLVAAIIVVANDVVLRWGREELRLAWKDVRVVVVAIVAATLRAISRIVVAVADARTTAAAGRAPRSGGST
jgi:hypothetical protein